MSDSYEDGDGGVASASSAPRSVHWLTGMLLTPQHFERQDEFVVASAGWALRYVQSGVGLVGGGLRTNAETTDLSRFDPRLEVSDDGETVRVALVFARGVTPGGDVVDVGEAEMVSAAVPRDMLAGVSEVPVSVVCLDGREGDPATVGLDSANPHQAALRRARYRLALGAGPESYARALVVGRVRRMSETLGFDRDSRYIPPCAAVLAHSRLYAEWARLRDGVVQLADRYGELHKAVAAYAARLAERGVDVRGDLDTLAFVERAVLALDECAYALADPARAPGPVFRDVERMGRRVALALDLSAATRLFLHAVSAVDAGYEVLLEEERQALVRRRGAAVAEADADLASAVERAADTVRRVGELCDAVEGKYLDYRLNRTVDALRFLLDRGGEGFYTAVATPGHPRRDGDLLTFDFSPLALPGRQEYRVLLVSDAQGRTPWQVGDTFHVDVWINPGVGGGRPSSHTLRCEVPGQRNFAVTFDGPGELGTVTSLRVTVHEQGHRLRRAALYQRGRGLVAEVAVVAVASAAPSAAPAYVPAGGAVGSGSYGGGAYGGSGLVTATPVPGTPVTPSGPGGTSGIATAPAQTAPTPAPSYVRDADDAPTDGTPVTGAPTPPPAAGVPVIKRIPLRKPGT